MAKTLVNFLALLILVSACARLPAFPNQLTTMGDFQLDLKTYSTTLPGIFLLTLGDYTKISQLPSKAYLTAIDERGEIKFERSFEHRYRNLSVLDFKPIKPDLYGYFLCYIGKHNCGEASLHFLDRSFHDIFPRQLPNQDPDVDSHDVLQGKNDNLFFIFYHPDVRHGQINTEIQEWNTKGEVVFSWRTEDHLKHSRLVDGSMDPYHLNAIDAGGDGNILLSLMAPSEIVKISYPDGKIIWNMSARTWSFPNDPLGGFQHQHSIHRLSNGNILLFDNGSGKSNRPSRAVEYKIDEDKKVANLVWEFRAGEDIGYRQTAGSVQRLSNGNTLIGWGAPAIGAESGNRRMLIFSEIDKFGAVVREMSANAPITSYRVFFDEKQK